jgi:hypothetical protein
MPRLAALALPAGAAGGAIHACHSFGNAAVNAQFC